MNLDRSNADATVWISLVCLVLAAPVVEADVVQLKSGRQIECIEAKVEGDLVHCKIEGGVVELPASLVEKIEKTKVEPSKTTASSSPAALAPVAPAQAASGEDISGGEASRLAREAFEKREYARAAEILEGMEERTLEEDLALASAYVKAEQWARAISVLETHGVDAADDPRVLYELGLCHHRLGHDDQAIRYLGQAEQTAPGTDAADLLARIRREKAALGNGDIFRRSHFLVRTDAPTDAPIVREILEKLDAAYAEFVRAFSISPRGEVIVIITQREKYYDMTGAPEWSGGLNDGTISLPIGGLVIVDERVEAVLRHELAHSFVRSVTAGNVPAWLNEGIAMHFGGDAVESRFQILAPARADGHHFPLRELENSFARIGDQRNAGLAYAEALLATSTLIRRYGFSEVARLLGDLGAGSTIEEALQRHYRLSVEELESLMWKSF